MSYKHADKITTMRNKQSDKMQDTFGNLDTLGFKITK